MIRILSFKSGYTSFLPTVYCIYSLLPSCTPNYHTPSITSFPLPSHMHLPPSTIPHLLPLRTIPHILPPYHPTPPPSIPPYTSLPLYHPTPPPCTIPHLLPVPPHTSSLYHPTPPSLYHPKPPPSIPPHTSFLYHPAHTSLDPSTTPHLLSLYHPTPSSTCPSLSTSLNDSLIAVIIASSSS